MALPCGHRTSGVEAEKIALVEAGECPGCHVRLIEHTEWVMPYGQCACCGWRWVVEDGEVRQVLFL